MQEIVHQLKNSHNTELLKIYGVKEINFQKQKWLMVAIHCPPSQPEYYFFGEIGKTLDNYIVASGHFNSKVDGDVISNFADNTTYVIFLKFQLA